MNMRIFTLENTFTRLVIPFLVLLMLSPVSYGDWSIDLSRRQNQMKANEMKQATVEDERGSFLDLVLHKGEPLQELVIINTKDGFVPSKVRVKEGARYKVHVVNVNSDQKNISFVMDAFSEHHGTYFGEIVTFEMSPKKSGVFSFQCPETSAEGTLVVMKKESELQIRQPASVGN